MKWVTTVTWIWVGLVLFLRGVMWVLSQPAVCKGDAAMGCGLLALMALPAWGLTLFAIPFLFALWLARFVRWVSHRRDEPPRIGYTAPPPPPAPTPQYSITGKRIR